MQFKTLVYSALVATVAAESLQEVIKQMSACAQTCVDTASPKIGCKVGDNTCQCSKVEDLTKAALPCISSGCDQQEMQVAMKVSTQICSIVAAGGADKKSDSDAKPSYSNSTTPASTGSAGSGTKVSASASAGASSTADPSTAGAAHNLAGMGIAAAALALAL